MTKCPRRFCAQQASLSSRADRLLFALADDADAVARRHRGSPGSRARRRRAARPAPGCIRSCRASRRGLRRSRASTSTSASSRRSSAGWRARDRSGPPCRSRRARPRAAAARSARRASSSRRSRPRSARAAPAAAAAAAAVAGRRRRRRRRSTTGGGGGGGSRRDRRLLLAARRDERHESDRSDEERTRNRRLGITRSCTSSQRSAAGEVISSELSGRLVYLSTESRTFVALACRIRPARAGHCRRLKVHDSLPTSQGTLVQLPASRGRPDSVTIRPVDRMLEATARAEEEHFWFRGLRRNARRLLETALAGRGRDSPSIAGRGPDATWIGCGSSDRRSASSCRRRACRLPAPPAARSCRARSRGCRFATKAPTSPRRSTCSTASMTRPRHWRSAKCGACSAREASSS